MCMGTVGNIAKVALPAAATIYGTNQQAAMMKDANKAQQKSYDKYLDALNPSADVQEARFNELKSSILDSASSARAGTSNRLAARGVRGQGAAAPISETDDAIQAAINDAYFSIYGSYNTPTEAAPADYSPSFWDLMGSNMGDIGSYFLSQRLGSEGDNWWNWGSGSGSTSGAK